MEAFIKKIFVLCFFLSSYFNSFADARIDLVFASVKEQKISITIKEALSLSSTLTPLTEEAAITDSRNLSVKLKIKQPGFFNIIIITGEGNKKTPYITTVYVTPQYVIRLEFLPKKR